MSRTFATKSGSADSLKVSARWGCRPKARQMRCTVEVDNPLALAMPRTPVRCTVRQALQGPDDHRLDAGVVHLARRTRARLVPQTLLPIGQEASAPLAHRRRIDVELRSDLLVGGPITGQKHDPRP